MRLLLWCQATDIFMSAWRLEEDLSNTAARAELDQKLPPMVAAYVTLQATMSLFACEFGALMQAFQDSAAAGALVSAAAVGSDAAAVLGSAAAIC